MSTQNGIMRHYRHIVDGKNRNCEKISYLCFIAVVDADGYYFYEINMQFYQFTY